MASTALRARVANASADGAASPRSASARTVLSEEGDSKLKEVLFNACSQCKEAGCLGGLEAPVPTTC